jgi:hypothetical protein
MMVGVERESATTIGKYPNSCTPRARISLKKVLKRIVALKKGGVLTISPVEKLVTFQGGMQLYLNCLRSPLKRQSKTRKSKSG